MTFEDLLPADLRGPPTVITPIDAGLSGAAVCRVSRGDQAFVLKVAGPNEAPDAWASSIACHVAAAAAGLTPPLLHVDRERRAVVTPLVADRAFMGLLMNPSSRDAALVMLGQSVRRLHELPIPPEARGHDPREMLTSLTQRLGTGSSPPELVRSAIGRVLEMAAPAAGRSDVLSHNDLNPSNLLYDGERLLFLDWATAGPREPYFDLAAAAVFLRLGDVGAATLLAAYEGQPPAELPVRFQYDRRLVAALCGAMLLHLATTSDGAPLPTEQDCQAAPTLAEFYGRLRTGAVNPRSPPGQRLFGLALLKESLTF